MLCYLPKPRNTVCLDFKALQAICKPDMKANNDGKNQKCCGFHYNQAVRKSPGYCNKIFNNTSF